MVVSTRVVTCIDFMLNSFCAFYSLLDSLYMIRFSEIPFASLVLSAGGSELSVISDYVSDRFPLMMKKSFLRICSKQYF